MTDIDTARVPPSSMGPAVARRRPPRLAASGSPSPGSLSGRTTSTYGYRPAPTSSSACSTCRPAADLTRTSPPLTSVGGGGFVRLRPRRLVPTGCVRGDPVAHRPLVPWVTADRAKVGQRGRALHPLAATAVDPAMHVRAEVTVLVPRVPAALARHALCALAVRLVRVGAHQQPVAGTTHSMPIVLSAFSRSLRCVRSLMTAPRPSVYSPIVIPPTQYGAPYASRSSLPTHDGARGPGRSSLAGRQCRCCIPTPAE